jgi:histone H3/H4
MNETMETAENNNAADGEGANTLIVISKVKKFIKEYGFNTSANFCDIVSNDIHKSLDEAIKHAQKHARKTVMGRDFNLYVDDPKIETVLVVASKVKAYIKEKSGLSTSSQAMDQLTVRVHQICFQAMEHAKKDKRKTVMDRDFVVPTTIISAPSKEA